MLKKIILIIAAVVTGTAYYIYSDPKLSRQIENKFKSQVESHLPDSQQTTPMYKWRDKQGQWQVSDQPPPAGIKYEQVQYHRDTNVIPSLLQDEKK